MMRLGLVLLFLMFGALSSVYADEPRIVEAEAEKAANGKYTFHVTVQHRDEGWKHYADKWEIRTLKGRILGRRVLHHPHVHEQPFERSLRNISIPPDIRKVKIRVHDNVHGYGVDEYILELPK